MNRYDSKDTIAAIATPLGESGIGIVRISGENALPIADKIFSSRDKKKPSAQKSYTIHYGWIVDEKQRQEVIDEVILTVMRAPKSFTREDTVEINSHGGIVPLRRILEVVLENGCRLAQPGEFTKRAFLNGRIDLAQAEAVLDIITSRTDAALKLGLGQLKGDLSKRLASIRTELFDVLTGIEAAIDFPEDQISFDASRILSRLSNVNLGLIEILATSRYGRIVREGVGVVICGKPNAGKSSLLNALLRQERSIVTHIAGTTRDTIEESIDMKGIPIKIIDTAGIIEPRDLIEKKAVARSKKYIRNADIVLLVFDGNTALNKEDEMLIRKLKNKTVLAVINKIDLKQKVDKKKLMRYFTIVVEISAKKSLRINALEDAIVSLCLKDKTEIPESICLSNARHIECVRRAQKAVAHICSLKDNEQPALDCLAQDIKDALGYIDEVTGKEFSDDLLDKIFSEFCIGK